VIGNDSTGTFDVTGGGIRHSGVLTINGNSLIQGNTSVSTGGGISVVGIGSTLTIDDSRVDNNTAASSGGGIAINPDNTVTVTQSSITRNDAGTDGGGVSSAATFDLSNTTVSANTAGTSGGGIHSGTTGTLTSTYSTIANNSAVLEGGGLRLINGATSVEGTILHGNTAPSGAECSGSVTSAGYNLVSDRTAPCAYAADPTDAPLIADPLLGPLTIGSSEYHPLGVGSAAIDAGGACVLVDDQIGNTRPIGPACDIGSIEGVSPVVGDDVLLVEPNGRWHIRKPGNPDYTFFYGVPGDVPLFGDWDNDGFDTPGMYRPSSGFVYLTNTLPPDAGAGVGENFFFYGNPGDQVFVGDWDGINGDSLGISRNGKMFLRNTNDTGPADVEFWFGLNTDLAFGANADGVGDDSVMVWRPTNSFLYYRNTLDTGVADDEFFFGNPGDLFVVGDWNADGIDTAGVFRSSDTTVYLKNTNVTGPADVSYVWGSPGWTPVAGVHGVS
jgi:predicted outer membrane repeat protein